jgi:hypothetical protein
MSVWLTIPSIRPGGGTIPKWREAGYKIAVLRQGDPIEADIHIHTDAYLGWAASINRLMRMVFEADPTCDWCVGGGDDTLPDPVLLTPIWGAEDCSLHFGGTFGVMQPTGDTWADSGGRIIERFAGSPWIGREFARRAYGGRGPLFEYPHCWADEELQNVATKLGVFWQRRDLTHQHQHWGRGAEAKPEWWDGIAGADYHASRALFEQRKKAGWPGHEVIP